MYYSFWQPSYSGELYHFGVKGMRWGVRKDRRYVTKGGSGYRHYNKVDKHLGDRQLIRKGTKMYRVKEHMIKTLSAKGYNAIVDEAGVGSITTDGKHVHREGQETLIIFDRSKTMKETGSKEVREPTAYSEYIASQQRLARMRARKPV